jgi:hypothetical protein
MTRLEPISPKIPVDAEGYGEAPPLHSLAALISISLDTNQLHARVEIRAPVC